MAHSPDVSSDSALTRCRVLIVGGGPAGLAAALMLAQRGWTEIIVVEKRAAIDDYEPDKSFLYQIDGRGQKLTDRLGITHQLADVGIANTAFYLTRIQPNGSRKTVQLPLIDPNRKTAYWIPRSAFVRLLYEEIQRHWHDQITVLLQAQCLRINKILTNEGTGETLEVLVQDIQNRVDRLVPDLLIGCDGIHSIVRATLNEWDSGRSGRFEMKQLSSPSAGLRYKVLSLPPKFPLDDHGQEHAVASMSYAIRGAFRDRRRFLSLGLLPLKDPLAPRTANLITRPNHYLWDLDTGETVLAFLEQSFPQIPVRQIVSTEEADRLAHSQGGTFPTPQYCAGLQQVLPSGCGVLLLGDAVHCFPPDMGQGVNAALEDVCVLQEALSQQQDDLSQALPLYEAMRAPDVEAIVHLAQTTAPWQYNQAPLCQRLWAVNFFARLALSRLIPWIRPPAFALIQNHQLSYHDIWRQDQQTVQTLYRLGMLFMVGILVLLWLLGSTVAQAPSPLTVS